MLVGQGKLRRLITNCDVPSPWMIPSPSKLTRATTERRPRSRGPMLLGHLFRLRVAVGTERGRIPDHFIARSQIGRFHELLARLFRIAQSIQGQGIIVMRLARLRSRGDRLGKIILRIIELPALIGLRPLFGQSRPLAASLRTQAPTERTASLCSLNTRPPRPITRPLQSWTGISSRLHSNASYAFACFRVSSSNVFRYSTSHSALPSTIPRE